MQRGGGEVTLANTEAVDDAVNAILNSKSRADAKKQFVVIDVRITGVK
jgi:hypothetical protein